MFLLATGLMIWQSSQFLGRSVSMWTANGSNLGVGLWTNETLYHVKSRPIVEQAQLVASGNALMDSRQFPVIQNINVLFYKKMWALQGSCDR